MLQSPYLPTKTVVYDQATGQSRLLPFRPTSMNDDVDVHQPHMLQAYVLVRLQRFAYVFAQRINPNLTPEQVEYATADALNLLSTLGDPAGMLPPQALRLVLRHDCLCVRAR